MDPLEPWVIRLVLFLQGAPMHLLKPHGNVSISSHFCCPQAQDFAHRPAWSWLTNSILNAAFSLWFPWANNRLMPTKVLIHTQGPKVNVILSKEDHMSILVLPYTISFLYLLISGIPPLLDWKHNTFFNNVASYVSFPVFFLPFLFKCTYFTLNGQDPFLISFSTHTKRDTVCIHNTICISIVVPFPTDPSHPVNAFQVFTQVQADF